MTAGLVDAAAYDVRVSRRAAQLAGSSLAELFALARAQRAVDMAVGTPGYPRTPTSMVAEAVTALRTGRNQYEDPSGEAALRSRIAASLRSPADPDTEITVTVGGTEALCIALLATVDPGDEVIVFEPFYENFLSTVTLAGAVPRFVPLHEPDWRLDSGALAAAFGPRTRAVILNSPANPTGRAHDADELREIAELCERWNVTVVSDEVYSRLVFDGREHLSVADLPELAERSIVIGSLSKSHAVSGWRLGYLRASARRTDVLRRVHGVTTNGTAAPLQFAAGQVDDFGQGWDPAAELALRRDHVRGVFERLGVRFGRTDGGCFLLGDIRGATDDDCEDFVRRLLTRSGVLVAPGSPFFNDRNRSAAYVRIAFNRSWEVLHTVERKLIGEMGRNQ